MNCYRCGKWPCDCKDGQTIIHGDCREVLPLLDPVDLVLTDPPYGVNLTTWDKSVPQPREWLYGLFAKSRTVYVTPSNANLMLYPQPTWTMAWFRPGSVQRAAGGGFSHWEPILVYGEHLAKVDAKQIKNLTQESGGHPCAKPLELFRWLVDSTACETVLDPFLGSGTTLRACKDLGRRGIGIEIEEKYCEIAANRLRQEVLF